MRSRHALPEFVYVRDELKNWVVSTFTAGLLLSGVYVMLTFIGRADGASVFLETVRTLVNDGTSGSLALGVSLLNAYAIWRLLKRIDARK